MYNNLIPDHLASCTDTRQIQAEGYVFEGSEFGGLWNSSDPFKPVNTEPLYRYRNPSTHDYDVGFNSFDVTNGYNQESILGYSFKRTINPEDLVQYPYDSELKMLKISKGGTTLYANPLAGGAIWQLVWNNTTFINHYDYGRQLQIAFSINDDSRDNPTEAGDRWTTPGEINKKWHHGSVLLEYSSAADRNNGILMTKTHPLQWDPQYFYDGLGYLDPIKYPVLWKGVIQKNLKIGVLSDNQIIEWETTITHFPNNKLNIEMVTAFLPGTFDSFYVYNLKNPNNPRLIRKSITQGGYLGPENDQDMICDTGGVIIYNKTINRALGIFYKGKLGDPIAGNIEGFTIHNFSNGTGGIYDYNTTKWALRKAPYSFSGSSYFKTAYIIVGTFEDVKTKMRTLASSTSIPTQY